MKTDNIAKEAFSIEKLEWKGMLYDFYGELLTEHQKKIYENAVFDDLSLSEIAEEHGITRQGIYDIVKRCRVRLRDYENRLHLVYKFQIMKEKLKQIEEIAQTDEHETAKVITKLAEEIYDII